MKKIFWGVLFLFINININGISLTPAFVGYLLIWFGLKELPLQDETEKLKLPMLVGGIASLIAWIPAGSGSTFLDQFLTVVSTAAVLITLYYLCDTMLLLERISGRDLEAEQLRKKWKSMAIFEIASTVLSLAGSVLLTFLALVAWIIAAVIFLAAFRRCEKRWMR